MLSRINLRAAALSRGELDRLIAAKHQGMLLNRSRRIRESAAKTSRYVSCTAPLTPAGAASLFTQEQVLERLLQRKPAWVARLE